jgi:membrane associated rhomboid family serine protease
MPVEYERGRFKEAPWATWMLVAFVCGFSIRGFFDLTAAVEQYGLIPAAALRHHGLTLLTSFLLHGDPFHLFGNMYFLFVFGDNVEDYLGKVRYAAMILLAAFSGDIAHIAVDPHSDIPLIGASGGISGIVAFYALKFPKARLGILFRFGLIPIRWFRFPAYAFVAFWIILQLLGAYLQIAGVSSVSALAHLGGAATGLLFWLVYRQT